MTIKEYAANRRLTENALYKAIKRAGHSTKELTDKRGKITAYGFTILKKIYPDGLENQEQTEKQGQEAVAARLQEAEKRAAEERERADKWERLYLELQEQAAKERAENAQQLKAAQVLLSQQQEINRRLMMNPIKRLFAWRDREKGKPGE